MKSQVTFVLFIIILIVTSSCRDHSRHIAEITINGSDDIVSNWISVSKPDYGEVWEPGTVHEIKWKSNTEIRRVNVDVFKKGSFVFTIISGMDNTGSYIWEIPEDVTRSNHFQIRVSSTNDGNLEGFSEVFYLVKR